MITTENTELETQKEESLSSFVKEAVDEGIKLYRKQLRQLNRDLEEFEQRRKKANARIERGARRTNGRIV